MTPAGKGIYPSLSLNQFVSTLKHHVSSLPFFGLRTGNHSNRDDTGLHGKTKREKEGILDLLI